MSDETIPEDVMAVAENIAADLPARVTITIRHFAARVIGRALAAERERCAKIAAACDIDPEYADFVAQAIRSSHE